MDVCTYLSVYTCIYVYDFADVFENIDTYLHTSKYITHIQKTICVHTYKWPIHTHKKPKYMDMSTYLFISSCVYVDSM